MNSLQGTNRHTCCHCQTEVLTIKGSTPAIEGGRPSIKFRLPLKHSRPNAIEQAALEGCPFFVWLWKSIKEPNIFVKRHLPPEKLKTTTMVFELEAVKLEHTPVIESKSADVNLLVPTPDCASQEFYDITGLNVAAEKDGRHICSMSHARFTAISDWGRKLLSYLPLQRLADLQCCSHSGNR